jgi:hypothetical protein
MMRQQCLYSIIAMLVALAAHAAVEEQQEEEENVCNCQYIIPNDWEPNCRVFGHTANNNDDTQELVAFERANETCLEQLGLATGADRNTDGPSSSPLTFSNEEMWTMCPLANGTNSNIQLVINEIQTDDENSTAVTEIRRQLPDFFQLSSPANDPALGIGTTFQLKDMIYDARTSPVNCQQAPRNCWSAIREVIDVNETLRAMVCTIFHHEQQMDNAVLQWQARVKLCEGAVVTTEDTACEPLATRIADLKSAGNGKECSSLFPPPNFTHPPDVPVCDFENPIIVQASESFRMQRGGVLLLLATVVLWASLA